MLHGRLDITIPFRGGLRLRLVARPGRWMDDARLQELVADLRSVADAATTGSELRYGVLSGSRNRLGDAILAVAYRRSDGACVAFNAVALVDVPGPGGQRLLHTGLCIISRGYRSQGLCLAISAAAPLLVFLRRGLRPLWITNVTQVPAAAGIFASMLRDVYPAPGLDAPPSDGHVRAARALMARREIFGVGDEAEFDARAFVIRDAYTGGSDHLKKAFHECATHRDGAFARLCLDRLDYHRGDDLLQVGTMTLGQAFRTAAQFAARATGIHSALRRLAARRPSRMGAATGAAL